MLVNYIGKPEILTPIRITELNGSCQYDNQMLPIWVWIWDWNLFPITVFIIYFYWTRDMHKNGKILNLDNSSCLSSGRYDIVVLNHLFSSCNNWR